MKYNNSFIADHVFLNGSIYTVDKKRSWAKSLAIKEGKIIYVGDNNETRSFIDSNTRVTDLNGKMMLPGFHDSHVHLISGGMQENKCDLTNFTTPEDSFSEIKRYVDAQSPNYEGWIECSGLGKDYTTALTKSMLDQIAPEHPLFINTSDGHSCWVNSKALSITGISKDTPDPPHGEIVRFPDSQEPNGLFHDFAAQLVKNVIPKPSLSESVSGLQKGIKLAHQFGITSIIEPGMDDTLMAPYLELSDRGELTLRVMASLSPINWQPGAFGDEIYDFVAARDKYRRSNINVESVKIYIDGVLENGSAVLLEPYLDPGLNGNEPFFTQEELNKYITWADGQDLQVHLHAIGDGGVRMALDAFEAARRANGKTDSRHHICHVQMVDPADVSRFGKLGVTATFQSLWAYPDPWIIKLNIPAVGEERLKKFYVIGSIHQSGGMIAGGSDWFVSSLNPLDAIETGIRRQDPFLPEGSPSLNPEEAVDLATMIDAYTINGAYLMHQEDITGSIEVGKRADLIVLDRNLFKIPATGINETQVVLTLFDGQIVYSSEAD